MSLRVEMLTAVATHVIPPFVDRINKPLFCSRIPPTATTLVALDHATEYGEFWKYE